MVAGVRIISTAGTVQVDDLYYNLSLRYKGVAATNTFNGQFSAWEATFSGLESPVIAIRSTALAFTTAKQTNLGGGNWSFTVGTAEGPTGSTFEYYIFDAVTAIPAHGAGLLVRRRNDRSKVAYYSGYPTMQIANVFPLLDEPATIATGAAKPAVVCGNPGGSVDVVIFPSEDPLIYSWFAVARFKGYVFSGSSLTFRDMQWAIAQGDAPGALPPAGYRTAASCIIIDVANL